MTGAMAPFSRAPGCCSIHRDLSGDVEGSMRDQEEERLQAEVTESCRQCVAAMSALTRPVHSVVNGGDTHRELLKVDADARAKYDSAVVALRAYRNRDKARASGGG